MGQVCPKTSTLTKRLKKEIDSEDVVGDFSEREIWWCRIGHNIGFEENGKNHQFSRPVLVFRKFNKRFFYGFPLSTKGKTGSSYHHAFNFQSGTSYALLSQLRAYDAKRLTDRMGEVPESTYNDILDSFTALFAKK